MGDEGDRARQLEQDLRVTRQALNRAREHIRQLTLGQGSRHPSMSTFTSYGGGIDQTAIIGHPPESREWTPDQPVHEPLIGQAARIEAFVTVDAGTARPTFIGDRTWLQKHVHVGHDAFIGSDCELAPGTVVCGHVQIGERVKIGVNATILPFRRIGDGAHIGAGAVITKDVPAGETWVGNPARKLENSRRDPRPHSERTHAYHPAHPGSIRTPPTSIGIYEGRGSAGPPPGLNGRERRWWNKRPGVGKGSVSTQDDDRDGYAGLRGIA